MNDDPNLSHENPDQTVLNPQPVESDALFRAIYDDSPIGIVIFDAGGQMLSGNLAVQKIFGNLGPLENVRFNLFLHSSMPPEERMRLFHGGSTRAETRWNFDDAGIKGLFGSERSGTVYLDILTTALIDPISQVIIAFLSQIQDITDRKLAELALLRHLKAEEIVLEISSRFLRTDADHLRGTIDKILQQLGEFVGCDRTLMILFNPTTQNIPTVQEWSAPGLPPIAADLIGLPIGNLDWAQRRFTNGEVIQFGSLDELPGEAQNECRMIKQLHIRACLGAPLMMDQLPQGLLGFTNERQERVWKAEDLHLLTLVGELLTSLMARVRAEMNLRQLNEDLEQRVAERTAQLEAANRELETFSYSVSHDLRAPLRAIDGYSKALWEDNGAQLDPSGKEYLERLRAANQRMGELVDDLLQLSQLTRGEFHRGAVDLSQMVTRINADFQQQFPERQVTLRVEPGLVVQGDARLLQLALENLIGNAWKFTAKHPQGLIEFGQTTKNGKRVYFIKDDGAGFDMNYAHKLFGAFQRLHDRHEFEGTGIGLATVQRIIRRHNGEVWAEGAVERGAVIYFSVGGLYGGIQIYTFG